MIIKKLWTKRSVGGVFVTRWEGWYLFGIIPLYIRQLDFERLYEKHTR